jgi:2-methylisocitrate lyase-like PEP mutase family enzyme
MTDWTERRATFRGLHAGGCFALPNPWDIPSVRRLERAGFRAIASSSAAAAWTIGKDDGELTLDEALAHLAMLCAATELPVNADFENGFADDPEAVAGNVTRAITTGIAGVSIEDRMPGAKTLYAFDDAVARVAATRRAIDRSGADVMLVARTEAYLVGQTDLEPTIARMKAFAEAGADVLYAPGMTDIGEIAALVAAVTPKPVNVLLMNDIMKIPDLAEVGVRRVSTGSGLAWAAWTAFDKVAADLRAQEG